MDTNRTSKGSKDRPSLQKHGHKKEHHHHKDKGEKQKHADEDANKRTEELQKLREIEAQLRREKEIKRKERMKFLQHLVTDSLVIELQDKRSVNEEELDEWGEEGETEEDKIKQRKRKDRTSSLISSSDEEEQEEELGEEVQEEFEFELGEEFEEEFIEEETESSGATEKEKKKWSASNIPDEDLDLSPQASLQLSDMGIIRAESAEKQGVKEEEEMGGEEVEEEELDLFAAFKQMAAQAGKEVEEEEVSEEEEIQEEIGMPLVTTSPEERLLKHREKKMRQKIRDFITTDKGKKQFEKLKEQDKRNRIKHYVEIFKNILIERQVARVHNLELQHKISSCTPKRIPQGESELADVEATHKNRALLNEFRTLIEVKDKARREFIGKLVEMSEDRDKLVIQVKDMEERLYELLQVTAENSKSATTGVSMSRTHIHEYLKTIRLKTDMMRVERNEYMVERNELEDAVAKSREIANLGTGFHLIDYEQLAMENEAASNRVQVIENEMIRLRHKIRRDVQMMSHIREKLSAVQQEISDTRLLTREATLESLEKRKVVVKASQRRDYYRTRMGRLRESGGPLLQPKILKSHLDNNDEIQRLEESIETLRKCWNSLKTKRAKQAHLFARKTIEPRRRGEMYSSNNLVHRSVYKTRTTSCGSLLPEDEPFIGVLSGHEIPYVEEVEDLGGVPDPAHGTRCTLRSMASGRQTARK